MSTGLRPSGCGPAAVVQYQRGQRVEVRRRRRLISLRLRHIILFVLLQAALFSGLQRLCFFLLEWDHLRLSRVEVYPRSEPGSARVEEEAARFLSVNLLLLDTTPLAARIKSLPWIKDARIRKSFPSTLRVDISVRRPLAVLDRGAFFLVDEEGVLLGPAEAESADSLPVLRDEGRFAEDFEAKISLARACLESLSPPLRSRVEELDLTDTGCLSLTLRDEPVRLVLGRSGFEAKVALYQRQAGAWTNAYGSLETVDFRLPGRAYLKPRDAKIETAVSAARGEVM
ncbi:MAG: hypothetical protein A2Y86_07095 [Candidatus Aminicenantes bacterium RBG_13_62_12]|nr:MAG: hypothetical protein A2Y86_07095 [Candidatus Aminicenantes bacterium RBG_13_62_12]